MNISNTKRSPLSAGFRLFLTGILAISLLINTVSVGPVKAAVGSPTRLISGGVATSFLATEFVEMNGLAYFLLQDATYGVALWRSNGTVPGTVFVKDIPEITSNISLTNVSGTLYITGSISGGKGDLWESDGTPAGTVLLKSGLNFSGADRFKPTSLNGTLYFGVTDIATDKTALWKSDGTAAGTVKVIDLGRSLGAMVIMNGAMYFPAPDSAPNQPGYWKSDGTATGTSLTLIEDVFPELVDEGTNLGSFTVVDDELFYWIQGEASSALVKTTGEPLADTIVKEKIKSTREPIAIDGTLYFSGWTYDTDPNTLVQPGLWKSDGTAAGTVFIESSFYYAPPEAPRPTMGQISSFANYDGQLIVFAWKIDYDEDYGSANGMELWTSDGTSAGTTLMKELPSLNAADTGIRAELNGLLYFSATTDDEGFELWETDGTTAGTTVIDLNPGAGYGYPGGLSVVAGKLFFWANDDIHGYRPWALTNI